jgi:hypothetical protein
MNDQATASQWTEQDEAEWQALQDDAEASYEESVCGSYASRNQSNIY